MTIRWRPRIDALGLRGGPPDRMLPLLAGGMAFLAALAGGGGLAAAGLVRHWQTGATHSVIIQVPDQAAGAVAAVLGPAAHRLSASEVAALLRPWLGDEATQLSSSLPAVFVLPGTLAPDATARLAQAAPAALVTRDPPGQDRFAILVRTLKGSAALALAAVGVVAVAVVAAATHAAMAACRNAIEMLHSLGASDGSVAGDLATRAMARAAVGGVLGVLLAVPVLLRLARLAMPLQLQAAGLASSVPAIPAFSWSLLVGPPALVAAISWITAQSSVRIWLRRLP